MTKFKLREGMTVRIVFEDGAIIESEWDDVWEELDFQNNFRHDPCWGEIYVGTNDEDAQWEKFEDVGVVEGTHE